METLTFADTRKLLDGLHAIYGLRDLDAFAQTSLAILEQLVPTEASMLATSTASLNAPQFHFNTPDFASIFTPEYIAQCEAVQPTHPFLQNADLLIHAGAHAFSDFLPSPEALQREDWQPVLEPVGFGDQIGLAIYFDSATPHYSEGLLAQYGLFLDWGRFTERDRLLLNLFRPHLNQAFQNAMHWQQQQQAIAQLNQALNQSGMIFLDPVGSVLGITVQAERWLRQYFPTPRTNRQLPDLIQAWVGDCLRSLQADAVPPVWVPLRLKQDDRQLVVRLVQDADQDHYLLLLAEEHLPSLLTALQALGLTPREAQILAAVMQGQEPKAIAQTLQIRPATVRKHLENIYRKLHVQSQTEAVARVLEQLAPNFQR